MSLSPLSQMLVAIGMMVVAVVLGFLMTIRVIAPSLGLSFLGFFLTIAGFIFGIIAVAQYIRPKSGDGG